MTLRERFPRRVLQRFPRRFPRRVLRRVLCVSGVPGMSWSAPQKERDTPFGGPGGDRFFERRGKWLRQCVLNQTAGLR